MQQISMPICRPTPEPFSTPRRQAALRDQGRKLARVLHREVHFTGRRIEIARPQDVSIREVRDDDCVAVVGADDVHGNELDPIRAFAIRKVRR
jgi:hypothetical protein